MQKTGGQYLKQFWRYFGKNAPKSTKIYGCSKVRKFKSEFSQPLSLSILIFIDFMINIGYLFRYLVVYSNFWLATKNSNDFLWPTLIYQSSPKVISFGSFDKMIIQYYCGSCDKWKNNKKYWGGRADLHTFVFIHKFSGGAMVWWLCSSW